MAVPQRLGRAAVHGTLLGLTVIVAYPLLWMLVSSLKSTRQIFTSPWSLPETLHWSNFSRAVSDSDLLQGAINSTIVVGLALVVLFATATPATFALTRLRFRGQQLLFNGFLLGLMFPVSLALVPLFLTLLDLGLLNTRIGLALVYAAQAMPFTVFLLSAAFRTLPHELEESALMDGASIFRVFLSVCVPLVLPTLVTAAVFDFLTLWNDYLLANVLLTGENAATLPVRIANLAATTRQQGDFSALFAGLTLVSIPPLALYLMLQHRLRGTTTAGAVKG